MITVGDDGPGIEATHLPLIFEHFFTTKGPDRTGLGLALCRGIVESHGGRIAAESHPGAGATFTVELPVPRGPAGGPGAAPGEAPAPARCGRVLLVEDDSMVGDLLARFLTGDGHEVDRATNGREALALASLHPYVLIVSDIRMPDVDGLAFYGELHAANPDLARRVAFVTGDIVSPETRHFLAATGLPYIEKPFGIAEFQTFVRRALGA